MAGVQRSTVGGKVEKVLRDFFFRHFIIQTKCSGMTSCQEILFYLMGLNLYTIKISSPNLMENIICSYRGNFKATVLNRFLFYHIRQKKKRC